MRLTGLFIYPLKSARGISLEQATLTPRGLEHDRRFMLVDAQGMFLSQRQQPQMARLAPSIEGDTLRIAFGASRFEVPLEPSEGTPCRARIWRDEVPALDLGDEAATFFTEALGLPARLVYMPDATARSVDPSYAAAHDVVSFADGFPYLLTNEASLADLNPRLEAAVPMNRFRPNLVVAGAAAYAEDGWTEIQIGHARFEVRKPCTRCAIITTDQESGERLGKEPLKTLSSHHTWQGKTVFGQNVLCRSEGTLHVGDSVVVLT